MTAMSGPVIACLDESPAGAAAAPVAASLARRLCAPLVLATVTGSCPVARARSVLLRQGAAVLADAAVGIGPDPDLRVELGEPAERLASLAQRTGALLVVLGVPDGRVPRGCGLGNAYLALAGTSPCPVVVVPPSMEALQRSGPIVCGLDGSDESLAAAHVAVDLSRRLDAPLQLVHVPERLADIAAREGAQLIVNGATGSSCLARTASQPLVLVRAGGTAALRDHSASALRSSRPPVRRSSSAMRAARSA